MSPPQAPQGWQRNVWALTLCVFIADVGFQFFNPFLPVYVRELGVTDPARVALWSGLIAGVTPAMSGLFTIIMAAMGLVTSVRQLFLARLFMGLFAGFTPMAMAVASVSAPRDKMSVAIARVRGAQLLGVAIGPAIGGVIASRFGTRSAIFATAAFCMVSLIAMILLLIAQFIDRGLTLMIPLQVAHMPGIDAIAATSGLIISVAAVGATLSSSVVARLAEVVPVGRLLLIQFAAGGALCAAMALAGNWVALLAARTLVALCLGGALTLAYSLGGMIVPAETRGAAFGWLAVGVQIGTAASPLLTGALAAINLRSAFVMDAGLAWIAAAVLVFGARDLVKRRDPRPR